MQVLELLASQAAISLENARLYQETIDLNVAYERFVPKQFLQILGKRSVIDVELGDCIQKTISVLFTDIRDYTTITEKQTPEQSYGFINDYLSYMAPIIRKHNGFINRYEGDAIMALFPNSADDAITAAIEMEKTLVTFNQHLETKGITPIRVGLGINTGPAMLGTVGEQERMEANVISDAVNAASRIESLNKMYQTRFLISDNTYAELNSPKSYHLRPIDRVQVKGKSQAMLVYEVLDSLPLTEREKKYALYESYLKAWEAYQAGEFKLACDAFGSCLQIDEDDYPTQLLLGRCQSYLEKGAPEGWDGTVKLTEK